MTEIPINSKLSVVLVADDPRQRYALNDLLYAVDVHVVKSIHSRQMSEFRKLDTPIFLVDIAYGLPNHFEKWAKKDHISMVCNDRVIESIADDDRLRFAGHLRQKLFSARNSSILHTNKQEACREVWILLASAGGPEAITEFMGAVHSGLGVGFVYLQHINDGFDNNLLNMLKNIGHYVPFIAQDGDIVASDKISIISGSYQTSFTDNGTFLVDKAPWSGLYKPSGNTVIATLAKTHLPLGGVIVFSGMGDDGIIGAKILAAKGGDIWAQTPSSCIVGAMPQKMLDEGLVTFQGTPRSLADRLNSKINTGNVINRQLISYKSNNVLKLKT